MKIPSRKAALALLEANGPSPDRIAHSVAVADLAVAIAKGLNDRGATFDVARIEAAASSTTSARACRTTTGPAGN